MSSRFKVAAAEAGARLDQYLATRAEGLSRARVERIELDTTRDVGEPILSFFRRRAARHGGAR